MDDDDLDVDDSFTQRNRNYSARPTAIGIINWTNISTICDPFIWHLSQFLLIDIRMVFGLGRRRRRRGAVFRSCCHLRWRCYQFGLQLNINSTLTVDCVDSPIRWCSSIKWHTLYDIRFMLTAANVTRRAIVLPHRLYWFNWSEMEIQSIYLDSVNS